MADWAKMRKVWTEARDKHGVKKGAVSGVSIGDAIEKVEKALSKDYGSVVGAAKSLDEALDKYRSKLAKTNPDFVGWIDKNIAKDLKSLAEAAKKDIAMLDWMSQSVIRETVMSVENLYPDAALAKKAYNLTLMPAKPATWAEACKEMGLFYSIVSIAPEAAKRVTTMRNHKWELKLKGRDSHYSALVDYASAGLEDIKFCIRWSKCADFMEFADFMKQSGSRTSEHQYHPAAVKAIKTLAG